MELDTSQKSAIEFPLDKSIFITAPPGYGKTYVITERIKYIISSGELRPPKKILALTFSNAAANEMKSRIDNEISQSDVHIDIMNFHTLSYKLLKIYGNYVGVERNFTIINDDIEYKFKRNHFEEIYNQSNEIEISKLVHDYDMWYSQTVLANEDMRQPFTGCNELQNRIHNDLITKNELTFNYILFKSLELLRTYPKLKNILFNKYPYILADEFQDTNFVQYSLFKEISSNSHGDKRNVFVVGDERQAIMKFQGANPENIVDLIEDFDCTEHELTKNHRTASLKIKLLTDRLRDIPNSNISEPFKMYTSICSRDDKNVINEMNSSIINKIFELKGENEKLHDICILFPLDKTPKELKNALNESNIDYIQITDYNFRSINKQYSRLFNEVLNLIEKRQKKGNVGVIIKSIIEKYYSDATDDLILNTIKNFSKKFVGGNYSSSETWENLQEFYNHLQIDIDWTDMVRSKSKDKIFLSTIHSVKGLEFKYIFMMGMVNYQIPHYTICHKCNPYNKTPKIDVPDSKDLFYVGVSRAVKDLFFFFSNKGLNSYGELKNRKITCVFEDIIDLLIFVDVKNDEEFDFSYIKNFCCKF